jgi:hypothetical protein
MINKKIKSLMKRMKRMKTLNAVAEVFTRW